MHDEVCGAWGRLARRSDSPFTLKPLRSSGVRLQPVHERGGLSCSVESNTFDPYAGACQVSIG